MGPAEGEFVSYSLTSLAGARWTASLLYGTYRPSYRRNMSTRKRALGCLQAM